MKTPLFATTLLALALAGGSMAQTHQTHVFLLIGQSNMAGAPGPEAIDKVTDPRIQVLAYNNCSNLGRTYNQWYTAAPPLHTCWGGVGPGDYFAKTLIQMIPAGDTIALVPCAIPGVDIDFFRKDVISARRDEFTIPPDNSYAGAYQWVIDRATLAKQKGTIRGILFHQGESNSGSITWVGQVREMVEDLRTDLELPDLPFVAGEVLYNGCCSGHNYRIRQIPDSISNSAVVSAAEDPSVYYVPGTPGLSAYDDGLNAHFSLEAQREFGKRYAEKMAALLPSSLIVSPLRTLGAGSASSGIQVRTTELGLQVHCANACSELSLVGLDGRKAVVSRADGLLPTAGLSAGLYALRVKDSQGAIESQIVTVR